MRPGQLVGLRDERGYAYERYSNDWLRATTIPRRVRWTRPSSQGTVVMSQAAIYLPRHLPAALLSKRGSLLRSREAACDMKRLFSNDVGHVPERTRELLHERPELTRSLTTLFDDVA